MLNPFPELLVLGILVPTLLRFAVGGILFAIGYLTLTKRRARLAEFFTHNGYPASRALPFILGIIEVIFGAFLIIGFSTQIVSLLSIYICINLILLYRQENNISFVNIGGLCVMIFVLMSLVISGAGLFAVDLPF